jgi:multidrug efflux pump subunit AcrA (membrane-fusion protein)
LELRRAEAQRDVDALSLEQARLDFQDSQILVKQNQARHDEFLLKAPMAGVVSKVIVAEGELVEQLKPIIRLVVIDPLWIDTAVPTNQTLDLKAGDPAWVQFTLPGHYQPVEAQVKYVDVVADAGSDTRLVRVEVPNPKGLPPGTHVTVSFTKPAPTPEPTAEATGNAVERAK